VFTDTRKTRPPTIVPKQHGYSEISASESETNSVNSKARTHTTEANVIVEYLNEVVCVTLNAALV
jgi:hypothetical protein